MKIIHPTKKSKWRLITLWGLNTFERHVNHSIHPFVYQWFCKQMTSILIVIIDMCIFSTIFRVCCAHSSLLHRCAAFMSIFIVFVVDNEKRYRSFHLYFTHFPGFDVVAFRVHLTGTHLRLSIRLANVCLTLVLHSCLLFTLFWFLSLFASLCHPEKSISIINVMSEWKFSIPFQFLEHFT